MSVDRKLLVCSTRRKHSHGRSEDNGSPETSWQQTHTLELCFTQKPQKAFRLSYSSARLKPSQVTHENTHKNIIRKKSEAKPDEKLFRTKSFNSRTRVEPFSVLGVFSGKRYKSLDGTFEERILEDPRLTTQATCLLHLLLCTYFARLVISVFYAFQPIRQSE